MSLHLGNPSGLPEVLDALDATEQWSATLGQWMDYPSSVFPALALSTTITVQQGAFSLQMARVGDVLTVNFDWACTTGADCAYVALQLPVKGMRKTTALYAFGTAVGKVIAQPQVGWATAVSPGAPLILFFSRLDGANLSGTKTFVGQIQCACAPEVR